MNRSTAFSASSPLIFVEAESLAPSGGWVVDQQFMDQMGSPYLLAHGLGRPVTDAEGTVDVPEAGTYRVWVRTKDWVAPWGAPGAPGRFRVFVGGKPLAATFGTEGAEWHWQNGGTLELAAGPATVALHDLTGFDGRCDAILFAGDPSFRPPDGGPSLAAFRRDALGLPEAPPEAGRYDLAVIGGGVAGICAAVSAARLGLSVALIQDRPVWGGNNSSEVRVHIGGGTCLPPYPHLGEIVRELAPHKGGNAGPAERYEDDKKARVVAAEENLASFPGWHVYRAITGEDGRITAVDAREVTSGREARFPAALFADCTGDGTLGALAGANVRVGRESRAETGEALAPEEADDLTMGTSNMWYARETDAPTPFPDCPWALPFNARTCQKAVKGDWNWEGGLGLDQVADAERIRDYNLRAVFGNWAFQKNDPAFRETYARRELSWVAYIGGKRESRRLLGDVILRQQDIEERIDFPDACVTTTWTIDLHYPEPRNAEQFPREPFRTVAHHKKIQPYPIPYRCLYSRNVPNLFMAGRDISVTHVALGTVRVMATTGMMGEVVGRAAAVCRRFDATPRGVYTGHLDDLKALLNRSLPPPAP